MAGIRLEGDVRALMKRLGKMKNIDLRGANLTLAETLRTSTIQRFKDEEDPDGKPWEPSLRAQEENAKTLTNTALLRRSIKASASSSGFAVGTNKKYAATHQFGDEGRTIRARNSKGLRFRVGGRWVTKKKVVVNIPARPFLGISEDDMEEIKETLQELVAGDE
ncbi:phage virion morphogenesis protein [Anaerovorax sp. IOR16]|uniref:phage virion morphogenesis protein n=1 Tax=Anaerovorax sp. IOR16 TaxID=2773458 RepID=UPI0019D13029|nr:phage virion morphogenesis protein [Anaerovorax sp. IOR16]